MICCVARETKMACLIKTNQWYFILLFFASSDHYYTTRVGIYSACADFVIRSGADVVNDSASG